MEAEPDWPLRLSTGAPVASHRRRSGGDRTGPEGPLGQGQGWALMARCHPARLPWSVTPPPPPVQTHTRGGGQGRAHGVSPWSGRVDGRAGSGLNWTAGWPWPSPRSSDTSRVHGEGRGEVGTAPPSAEGRHRRPVRTCRALRPGRQCGEQGLRGWEGQCLLFPTCAGECWVSAPPRLRAGGARGPQAQERREARAPGPRLRRPPSRARHLEKFQ